MGKSRLRPARPGAVPCWSRAPEERPRGPDL